MMPAIIAALPREIAALVKASPADTALLREGLHLHRLPHAVVVAGGMGSNRVTLAVQAALQHKPDTLISVGLAGACLPSIAAGQVLEAGTVVDVQTGERFQADTETQKADRVVLATSTSIASTQEKRRLAAAYAAAVVDMEAATVARLARAHGLRFRAIKGISDAHDFELASLARFEGRHGTFRTGRFALHTAMRPHHWRKTITLGRSSAQALAALQRELQSLVTGDE